MKIRLLIIITMMFSLFYFTPAHADMGVEGVVMWIGIFSGIFIAYTFGITKAVFWAMSRKNAQKQIHVLSYKIIYPILVIAGSVVGYALYVFICVFLTRC